MKALYRMLAKQHRLPAFKRSYDPEDWDGQDPVNLALSAANTCLYGIAHAAITALGCSPGLGFVHTGTTHAFVYDIADLYKAELSLPLAFSLHASREPEAEARRSFRQRLNSSASCPASCATSKACSTRARTQAAGLYGLRLCRTFGGDGG